MGNNLLSNSFSKKLTLPTILLFCNVNCASIMPYYGFLPGSDYEIYKSQNQVDLKQKKFSLSITDKRDSTQDILCFTEPLDRQTELEGDLGLRLINEYFTKFITGANGAMSGEKANVISVDLEGLSFRHVGYVQITTHGIAQISVKYAGQTDRFCIDITDKDDGAPLRWYSFDTRVGASRKLTSAAVQRAVDKALLFISR